MKINYFHSGSFDDLKNKLSIKNQNVISKEISFANMLGQFLKTKKNQKAIIYKR